MFKLRRDVAPELITELIAPNRKHGHELTLFRMGIFGAAHEWRRPKKPPPLPKICDISYNGETWHSYTLPREDPKNI